ncbi:hypothetical protein L323_14940 [Ruminiclostridium papyrosolvens C7]|uniref:Uncharacterized protein n=1 Tax=Ruminiclostridium papyrosolvens C7 TaxID=1330534 RepID=U4QYQ7_9FIRM|nr:hypothetical protein L323_14940 [Ruminiclostridium papyrosolvens C7]
MYSPNCGKVLPIKLIDVKHVVNKHIEIPIKAIPSTFFGLILVKLHILNRFLFRSFKINEYKEIVIMDIEKLKSVLLLHRKSLSALFLEQMLNTTH